MTYHKILLRQGLKKDLPQLSIGELGFCTDTKEIYIGSEFGNLLTSDQDLYKYAYISQGWTQLDKVPEDINLTIGGRSGNFVYDGKLFIVGGYDRWNSQWFDMHKQVVYYDTVSGKWGKEADLPYYNYEPKSVAYDGKMYSIISSYESPTPIPTAETAIVGGQRAGYVYDFETKIYTPIPPAPVVFMGISGVSYHNHKLYVFADGEFALKPEAESGSDKHTDYDQNTFSNTRVFIYDINAETWSEGTPSNIRFNRGECTSFAYEGRIYVHRSFNFQAYDPVNDVWDDSISVDPVGGVHGGTLFVHNGKIYTGFGYKTALGSEAGTDGKLRVYDIENDTWSTFSTVRRLSEPNQQLTYGYIYIVNNMLYTNTGLFNWNLPEPIKNKYVFGYDLESHSEKQENIEYVLGNFLQEHDEDLGAHASIQAKIEQDLVDLEQEIIINIQSFLEESE